MRRIDSSKKNSAPKYDHLKVENGKYASWLDKKYFEAGDLTKKPYAIVIPPPNVTGKTSFRTCLGYYFTRYDYPL